MARILVIDDEPRIVNFVTRALEAEGYGVDSALDGARGLELARAGNHELVLLDLLMPSLNGVSVLKEIIKASADQRVIVLSALSDVQSKVRCLELGASDYLPKPFELAELLARIRARLRQSNGALPERVLRAGRVTLELLRRTADSGKGPVSLSEREFLLLQHLMRRFDRVCTREELLGDVWGYTFDPGTNVVDVYIGRLRAKLGSDVIETVRNVGYCLQTI
jgi:two-component system, OmpR family, response regulator